MLHLPPYLLVKKIFVDGPLQWISTHFGRVGVEISWELCYSNYVTEVAVSLLLMAIKLPTLKRKPRV